MPRCSAKANKESDRPAPEPLASSPTRSRPSGRVDRPIPVDPEGHAVLAEPDQRRVAVVDHRRGERRDRTAIRSPAENHSGSPRPYSCRNRSDRAPLASGQVRSASMSVATGAYGADGRVGKARVAPALLARRAFQHHHCRLRTSCADSAAAQASDAAADHDHSWHPPIVGGRATLGPDGDTQGLTPMLSPSASRNLGPSTRFAAASADQPKDGSGHADAYSSNVRHWSDCCQHGYRRRGTGRYGAARPRGRRRDPRVLRRGQRQAPSGRPAAEPVQAQRGAAAVEPDGPARRERRSRRRVRKAIRARRASRATSKWWNRRTNSRWRPAPNPSTW